MLQYYDLWNDFWFFFVVMQNKPFLKEYILAASVVYCNPIAFLYPATR